MAATHKHLKSGSECPPLKEKQLRLYSMRFCPFVRRAKLVLAAKNIPYEEVLINLNDAPDWYLKKNPSGEVPLLEWIDQDSKQTRSIPESLIICNYLDELHPENRVHPTDPYLKAKQQILIDRFGNVRSYFYKIVGGKTEELIEELNKNLAVYESELYDKFFGGSKPSMLDYMIWPWFELMSVLEEFDFVLNPSGKSPKIAAWINDMLANEVVATTKVPNEIIQKFIKTVQQGNSNYDVE